MQLDTSRESRRRLRAEQAKAEFFNKTFGLLTILPIEPEFDAEGQVVLHCICACGTKRPIQANRLKVTENKPGVKSCGCLRTSPAPLERVERQVRNSIVTRLENIKAKMIGRQFGRLTVKDYNAARSTDRNRYWHCQCECGNTKDVSTTLLQNGGTRSCGCLSIDTVRERSITHGKAGSPEYKIWGGMVNRCYNEKSKQYAFYGALGRTVCDRWRGKNGFEHFLADMGQKPTPAHTIERIDNEKGYFPDNCRWATKLEQAQNTRNVTLLHFNGEALSHSAWARKTGICQSVISRRIRQGWPTDQALSNNPDRAFLLRIGAIKSSQHRTAR